jgi:hypothetical protein
MNPTDPVASGPPAPVPLAIRAVRVVALLGLALAFTLIPGLAVTSLVLAPSPAGWLTLAAVVLVPAGLLFAAARLGVSPWWRIAGGYLVVAIVLAYLASDDPIVRHPLTLEEIAPAFPGAGPSYAVLMRYSKQHPGDEARAFDRWRPRLDGLMVGPDKPAEWPAFLQARRADIEADWADLAPQRRWLAELNAFDRIGDLGEASPGADIIAFSVWRRLSQHAAAEAGLQALDGHGDEAFATLLPVLQASRKLEPSSRTLVRFMVARVVQRLMLGAAGFVLDHSTVSPAARAAFAAALAGGSGGEAAARRMIAIEYAMLLGGYFDRPIGDLLAVAAEGKGRDWGRRPLNLLSPFLYNPRRTANLYGEFSADLQELAAHRALDKLGPRSDAFFRHEAVQFKNLMGGMLMSYTVPAFTKIAESYWKCEDERAALLARLTKPTAAYASLAPARCTAHGPPLGCTASRSVPLAMSGFTGAHHFAHRSGAFSLDNTSPIAGG